MNNSNRSKLGISNIGWGIDLDASVAELLSGAGVRFIDIAPTKYFDWQDPNRAAKAKKVRNFWKSHDVSIRGMQSLLFGRPELNIFSESDRQPLLEHFKLVFEIADATGAEKLVFGSPSNRKKGGLPNAEADRRAVDFFLDVSALIPKGMTLLIEPNPTDYGCDYVTTTQSAVDLVKYLETPNIKAQLDLGTCIINGENPLEILVESEQLFGYVHLATRGLLPLQLSPNALISDYLAGYKGELECSIEQRASGEPSVAEIKSSIDWIQNCLDG